MNSSVIEKQPVENIKHHPSRARTLAVLVVAVIASAAGDLLLSHGMKQVGSVATLELAHLRAVLQTALGTPSLLCGILCMAVFFALYLVALSWADLSFVLPITALSFVAVALFAGLCLGEQVSPMRWLGILSIVGGVAAISRS